jgi:hypothetical protein
VSAGASFGTVAELVQGIRSGLVPRAVRLFAAQGLLPVTREELIRLLALLAAEGDSEIAGLARQTLAAFTPEHFLAVLSLEDLEPLDLDLLARSCQDETFRAAVARDPRVANETLRWLALSGPPSVQDAIVTNQTRLLGCLELLADLRANPQVSQDVLRRVREFEEEFLEKACQWAAGEISELPHATAPSIEEALAALKAIGMNLPGGEPPAERLPEPEPGEAREQRDTFLRLAMMNTYERIMQALKGTRQERLILVRDRSLLVVRAVIMSPQLQEADVEEIAGMRSVNEEALRLIAARGRWLRRYRVVRNLAFNPKTPPGVVIPHLSRLSVRDLGMLCRDHNVSEAVRRAARQLRESRHM